MLKTISMFSLIMTAAICHSAIIQRAQAEAPGWQQGTAVRDLPTLLQKVAPTPVETKLRKTGHTTAITKWYSAVTEHVQGLAKVDDKVFVLTHSCKKKQKPLIVVVDQREAKGQTIFKQIGDAKYPHPGAFQACGQVAVIPTEPYYQTGKGNVDAAGKLSWESEILFVDFRNPAAPKQLACKINRKGKTAGAAGLAYHPGHKRHYLIVAQMQESTKGGWTADFYQSNGAEIGDNCRFTLIKENIGGIASQGGMQLMCDQSGALYLLSMKERSKVAGKEDHETVSLFRIDKPGDTAAISFKKVADRHFGKSNQGTLKRLPSFRYGGAVYAQDPDKLEVLAAARLLLFAPVVADWTKVKSWSVQPAKPVKNWIDLRKGPYNVEFDVSWSVNGQTTSKTYRMAKALPVTQRVDLPANASGLKVTVRAGRLKGFKIQYKKQVGTFHPKFGQTVRATGTSLLEKAVTE